MFIGHFAPALVAAAHPKAPSLPTLFVAAQLVDWAFFGLLLTGIEKMRLAPGISVMNPMDLYHMPYTHSLLATLAWAGGFALVLVWRGHTRAAARLGGAVVLSHWILDLIVHVPDLTLFGQPPKLGLGLWNHPLVAMPLEIGLTLGALWIYGRATGGMRPGIWALMAILLLLQTVNWFAPHPETINTGTSLLAFFAFGIATLAAGWAARGHRAG